MPDFYDCPLQALLRLGAFGHADVQGFVAGGEWCGGRLEVCIQVHTVRVYDVWVDEGDDSWTQLQRVAERWVHEDVGPQVERVRFWVAPMDLDAVEEAEQNDVEAAELAPYVPVVDGEPPLPSERTSIPSRLTRWVHARSEDVVVAAMLDEWTEAAGEAAALGWMCGLPRGEDLLMAYVRSPGAADRVLGHEAAFARWLVAELGRSVRAGLHARRDAENRRAGVQRLLPALGRLLRALDPDLEVVGNPPAVIGPRERHHWLVDETIAARLDNPVVAEGAHRPVFVVRPKLCHRGRVLLEGEVV